MGLVTLIWRKWGSIRSKILASFIVLLIIPMSLIAVFNYWKSASILEDKAREQFVFLSEGTNQQFNQYITNLDTISMNIVEAPVIQERLQQPFVPSIEWTMQQIEDEKEVKRFLEGIHKLTPGLSGIAVYGFNGIVDFTHPTYSIKMNYDPTREKWYDEALELDGKWVLSGKRIESEFAGFLRESDEEVVTFSRAVINLNSLEPMGVLAINIKISALKSLMGISDTGRHFVMMDREGNTVLSTDGAELRLRDESWLQTSSISPLTGWTSIHLVSKDDLFKESKSIRNFIILVVVLLSLGAVVFAHLFSSGIVKPLRTLKGRMREVEKGHLQGELPVVHRDEVGELTQRFNRMMARMRDLIEENRLREQQKMQLEMDALQARINPHFLYNTLMALRIQAVSDGNYKLGELITALVHLLKFSAKNKRKEIRLEEEMELTRQYIRLLQLRNENFDFHLEMQPGMEDNLVFPFLLQPIVENAVFHGIGPLQRKGKIKISLRMSDGRNIAVVEDDGVGMDREVGRKILEAGGETEGRDHFHKIGIRNVYERLRLQYNESAEMSIDSGPGIGTKVIIKWPVKTEGKKTRHECAAG